MRKFLPYLALVALSLAAIELLSWSYLKMTGRATVGTRNEYRYVPHLGYFPAPFQEVKGFATDRHGFISNGYDVDRDLTRKDSGEYRVFVIGSSLVAGTCVGDIEKHIASRLEKQLRSEFQRQQIPLTPHVINAGVSGYFSIQGVALFQHVIRNLQPDLAIFFDGVNEIQNAVDRMSLRGNDIRALMRSNYDQYSGAALQDFDDMFSLAGLGGQLFKWSTGYLSTAWLFESERKRFKNKIDKETARLVNAVEGRGWTVDVSDYTGLSRDIDEQLKPTVERYERNVRDALSLNEFDPQIAILYILQPTLVEASAKSERERELLRELMVPWQNSPHTIAATRARFLQLAEEALGRIQRQTEGTDAANRRALSFRATFDNKGADNTYFCDNVHYSFEGYSAILRAFEEQTFPWIFNHARSKASGRS